MYSKMQDLAVGLCEVEAGAANVDFGFGAGSARPALNAQEPKGCSCTRKCVANNARLAAIVAT